MKRFCVVFALLVAVLTSNIAPASAATITSISAPRRTNDFTLTGTTQGDPLACNYNRCFGGATWMMGCPLGEETCYPLDSRPLFGQVMTFVCLAGNDFESVFYTWWVMGYSNVDGEDTKLESVTASSFHRCGIPEIVLPPS